MFVKIMEDLRDPKGSGQGSVVLEDLMISYHKYTNSADAFCVGYKLSPVDGKPESLKLKVLLKIDRRKS